MGVAPTLSSGTVGHFFRTLFTLLTIYFTVFIESESDHWECLSLTHCHLVNLIDVTLACEDGNSKFVEVVTVVNVDDEKCVDNSLVQISKVKFGHKANFLFRL